MRCLKTRAQRFDQEDRTTRTQQVAQFPHYFGKFILPGLGVIHHDVTHTPTGDDQVGHPIPQWDLAVITDLGVPIMQAAGCQLGTSDFQHVWGDIEGLDGLDQRRQQAGQAAGAGSQFDSGKTFQGEDVLNGAQDIALVVLAGNQRFILLGLAAVDFRMIGFGHEDYLKLWNNIKTVLA
jgi:hypothetical protein